MSERSGQPEPENQDPPWPTMHPADDYDGVRRPPDGHDDPDRAADDSDDDSDDDALRPFT